MSGPFLAPSYFAPRYFGGLFSPSPPPFVPPATPGAGAALGGLVGLQGAALLGRDDGLGDASPAAPAAGGPGPAPPATPALWLDFTALALADGDPVGACPGAGGTAVGASAAGAQRPTFRTNQIHGRAAATFDGASQWLALSSNVVLSAGCAVYAVGHYNGPATVWILLGGASTQVLGVFGDNVFYAIDDSGFASVAFPGAARDLTLRLVRPDLATPFALTATGFATQPLAAANAAPSTLAEVMTRLNGAGGFGAGALAELIVYDRALSAGEQTQVESYLAGRYALALP